MRKGAIGICLVVVVLLAGRAYADIPISFESYLMGITDGTSTLKLQIELDRARQEIEALAPRVEEMHEEYKEQEEAAVTKLLFYNSIGLDTYFSFIMGSRNVVDALGNYRIVERKLQRDLEELDRFHNHYMLYKVATTSLERFTIELDIIGNNLAARERFLEKYGHLTTDEMMPILEEQWDEYVQPYLHDLIVNDTRVLNENMNELLVRRPGGTVYWLEEEDWDVRTELTYFFESEHVYVHYARGEADLVLIGILFAENQNRSARLVYEGGFLNGMLVPYSSLERLPSLHFDFSNFAAQADYFFVAHSDQGIMVQPLGQPMGGRQ